MNTDNMRERAVAVSVVVPVYNVEKYIERCLDSLVRQKFGYEYEIIIVNDGTKDNSMTIADRFASEYDFIRIITQQNAGLSAARNTGLANARGEYIAFVDSDDFVSPFYISEMYTLAVKNNADIVQCRYCNYFEKSDRSINVLLSHRNGVIGGKKAFEKLISDVSVRNYAWNKLYRRSLFTDNNISYPVGKCFEAYLILSEYLAENGIYYICRTRISVMTLKVLITLYGMIARQYMAGKGNGGSYISDCREVRNTVKKQLRLLSPAYLKRAQKKQLSKTN